MTRGGLPVVIVDRWSEVTPELLAQKWDWISSQPRSHWDWRRLFVDHWLQRLDESRPALGSDDASTFHQQAFESEETGEQSEEPGGEDVIAEGKVKG